jgi:hypothetical protein
VNLKDGDPGALGFRGLAAAAAARHSCVLVAAAVIAAILWLKCVGIGGGKCVFQVFCVSSDGSA